MKINRLCVDIYPHEMGDRFFNCYVRVCCDGDLFTFQWPIRVDDFEALFQRLMERAEQYIMEAARKARREVAPSAGSVNG